jgi:DNA-binding CsgD family transcriptional regulator
MGTGLVGRAAEARTVASLLDAPADGSATVIIEGEPGIGKSTLWFDGVERARGRGVRVLSARTSAAESVLAYAALADLLVGVEPQLWADLPLPQRRGLAAALLTESGPSGPALDQRAVGAALLAIVKRLTEHSPVLFAIDDLQWIDASSAAAVAFAARRMSGPVTFLCTARSDLGSTASAELQFGPPDAVHRIRLGPLSVGELHEVLVANLGNTLPRPRLLHVHRVSGGNPFYAVELARELEMHHDGTEFKLPGSLTVLTEARIGRIRDDAKDALLAIASLAAPTVGVVAHALELAPQRLAELLEDAETTDIVVIEGNRVRFTHPLLAHAVHSSASPARRRSMHRRLADIVDEPELRARHLALSDPAGGPATLEALDGAATIARGRGAPAAAAELLELAIQLGGATGRRRILLANCLFDAGDPHRAREVLEDAIATLARGPERAQALQQLALVRLYDDSFSEAAELGRRALGECVGESALRVSILTVIAFAELNMGLLDAALVTAEQAVTEAVSVGLAEPLSRAVGMRAMMRFMNGEGAVAADLRQATALDDLDSPVPLAFRPTVQSALLRGWTGDMLAARRTLAQFGQRSEALGQEGEMLFIDFQLVTLDIWLGDLVAAAATADQSMQRARQLDGDASRFLALAVRGAVAAYQGRVEDARRDLAGAVVAGTGSGYVLMMTWTIAIQAFVELSLGDHAKVVSALEPLLPMVKMMPRYTEILGAGFVPDAAEAMVNLGRFDEAEELIEALERNGTRLDRAWMLASGARCRAMLSAARGDVRAGMVHAKAALAHHDRIDMPFERARTLLVLGKLQRRLRQWQPAGAVLTEALDLFETVGTPLWAAQARAQLDRGSAGRPRSSGLTPAEQRVAELAATGMNNQEIAAALFIARKTVEVNLSRIYRKLGIRSRVELYAVMINEDRNVLTEAPKP